MATLSQGPNFWGCSLAKQYCYNNSYVHFKYILFYDTYIMYIIIYIYIIYIKMEKGAQILLYSRGY